MRVIGDTHTGSVDVKKSINLPMVIGIDMDTAEDIKSRPIACVNGFFSALASPMIFLNEDAVGGPSTVKDAGRNLARIDFWTGALGEDSIFGVSGLDSVAKVRVCAEGSRLVAKTTGRLSAPDVNRAGRAQLRPA